MATGEMAATGSSSSKCCRRAIGTCQVDAAESAAETSVLSVLMMAAKLEFRCANAEESACADSTPSIGPSRYLRVGT